MQQDQQYVYKVFKEGSFSKAAEKLYVTQPTLSIAIGKIEKDIGMPLFDRSSHPLTLTSAGKVYISKLRKIMEIEDELDQEIDDIKCVRTGNINMGGSCYFNSIILPKVLYSFTQEYPNISLNITEASSYQLISMLRDKTIDFTFSCNPIHLNDFEHYHFFDDNVLVAVNENHPINDRLIDYRFTASDIIAGKHLEKDSPSIGLENFAALDFILLSDGNNLYSRAMKMFEESGVTPKVKIHISQLVSAFAILQGGFEAAFICDRQVVNANVPLFFYKLSSEQALRHFYILLPDRNYTSNAVRTFIDYLRKSISR